MIRYLNNIGFLVCCIGLPLQANSIMPVLTTCPVITAAANHGDSEPMKQDASPLARTPAATTTSPTMTEAAPGRISSGGRLSRVTAYWAGEGDYYTGRLMSATGVHLHGGHCAVDPRIIPYGSMVEVAGVGKFLAVDTGAAVVTRRAAREAAHTSEERNALVIDLFFESRRAGKAFAANAPKYASISWWTPSLASTFSPAPVITPISMLLRLGMPIHPLRSPVGIATQSYAFQ
jgi:3D (Asp-Asp-Asp) domain-containing protein